MKVFYLFFKSGSWHYQTWKSLEKEKKNLDRLPSFKDLGRETSFIFKFSDLKREKHLTKKLKLASFFLIAFVLGKHYKVAIPFFLLKILKSNVGKEIFLVGGDIGEQIYRFHHSKDNGNQLFIFGKEFTNVISKDTCVFQGLSWIKSITSSIRSLIPLSSITPPCRVVPKTEIELVDCRSAALVEVIKEEIKPTTFTLRYFDIFKPEAVKRGFRCIERAKIIGATEISTYDEEMSKKAGIAYVLNRVDLSKLKKIQAAHPIKFDCCYLGLSSPGRDEIEDVLFSLFRSFNLNVFALIRCFKRQGKLFDYPIHTEVLPYEDYLVKVAQSKAIVDLWRLDENEGYSYRLSEAMALNKKIITNRRKIQREPFYDPARFFILGVDKEEKLGSFLSAPLPPLTEEQLKPFVLP